MAVKALFLTGKNTTSTESLYQWDYGQVLEIEAPDLGSLLCEVHFACQGMSEAIVRPCTLSAGVGTVTIPDDCLEQSTPITAWIYEKGTTHGRTRCVISIPMIARARPRVISDDIPQSATDQYTLLIGEVNAAINDIENGIVKAKYAENADMATNAGYATAAGNASSANHAVSADSATKASTDEKGQSLTTCLHAENHLGYTSVRNEDNSLATIRGGGVFAFTIGASSDGKSRTNLIMEVSGYETEYSPMIGYYLSSKGVEYGPPSPPEIHLLRLKFVSSDNAGCFTVQVQRYIEGADEWSAYNGDLDIKYKRLSITYPIG